MYRPIAPLKSKIALSFSQFLFAIGLLALGLFLQSGVANAQVQSPGTVLPKLKYHHYLELKSHPDAYQSLLSHLPQRPTGRPTATPQTLAPATGGAWTLVKSAPSSGLCNPLLLTDGTVMVHNCGSANWYVLTPDNTGNYANGTWKQIASLPVINGTQYAPQYHASAVLSDGRVLIEGGEYNNGSAVWSNLGAIYDPVLNSWTAVTPPTGSGWTEIGDASGLVLPNNVFMLGGCCANPPANALFNAGALNWTATGAPSSYQDEQGYTLLPNDTTLTIDVWAPPKAEVYNANTKLWGFIANTPVALPDPSVCGTYEMGPAITRPDGSVVAFGGNTGCSGAAFPYDPTAIYSVTNNSWTQGPSLPALSVGGTNTYFTMADAPAVVLPNGNILMAASPGFAKAPTHFFEFAADNTIAQVNDPIYYAASSSSYYYNFLILPTGQILMTDFSNTAEIYTPAAGTVSAAIPTITSAPDCAGPSNTYSISGTQLNGLTEGAAYGDDAQSATNYPIIQIKNQSTNHITYARTFNFSNRSIAPNASVTASFTIAANTETGASTMMVIANGVPSAPRAITIDPACASTPTLSLTPTSPISVSGPKGGTFTPATSTYSLSAFGGTVNFTVTGIPDWLTANPTSGQASGTAIPLTFTVNANAQTKALGTYTGTINISSSGLGGTSIPVTLNVTKALTVTNLTSSLTSATRNTKITLTARVTNNPVNPYAYATGTVTFKDAGKTLGTATLSSGVATYATSTLAKGTHNISAIYAGDASNSSSTSNSVSISIR